LEAGKFSSPKKEKIYYGKDGRCDSPPIFIYLAIKSFVKLCYLINQVNQITQQIKQFTVTVVILRNLGFPKVTINFEETYV